MWKPKLVSLAAAMLFSIPSLGRAADDCVATALKNSPAVETDGTPRDNPSIKGKGASFTVSQKWLNEKSGRPTYCEHGGYCFLAADFKIQGNCRPPQILVSP